MCPLSSHQDANQYIKLNKKQKYPKLMYKVSVMCSLHLCSDKLCFYEPEGVYIVFVRS